MFQSHKTVYLLLVAGLVCSVYYFGVTKFYKPPETPSLEEFTSAALAPDSFDSSALSDESVSALQLPDEGQSLLEGDVAQDQAVTDQQQSVEAQISQLAPPTVDTTQTDHDSSQKEYTTKLLTYGRNLFVIDAILLALLVTAAAFIYRRLPILAGGLVLGALISFLFLPGFVYLGSVLGGLVSSLVEPEHQSILESIASFQFFGSSLLLLLLVLLDVFLIERTPPHHDAHPGGAPHDDLPTALHPKAPSPVAVPVVHHQSDLNAQTVQEPSGPSAPVVTPPAPQPTVSDLAVEAPAVTVDQPFPVGGSATHL